MLTRRSQILGAVETTEGTPATLTSANYIQALDAVIDTPQDIEDNQISGASLSEDIGIPGRSSFSATFSAHVFNLGSGLVASPPLVNAVDPLLRASGTQPGFLPYITVSVGPTGPEWPGQQLTDGLTGTATLAVPVGTSGRVYYRNPTNGFPNDTTISTPTSGTITLTGTTVIGNAWVYRADSLQTAYVAIGAWTGTPPLAGETVSNGLNGNQAARGIVVSIAANLIEIVPALPFRAFLVGETVTALVGLGTTTVAAGGQTLARTPSLTLRYNNDGYYIQGTGCRGNFTLDLEAGKVGKWNFTFSGQLHSDVDSPMLTGITDVAVANMPRWHNAVAHIDGFEIPLSRMSVDHGARPELQSDAHGANGVRGSVITARQSQLTADFDRVPKGVLSILTRMQNGAVMSFFSMWGGTVGFRQAVHIPRGQIYQATPGDRQGVRTNDLTVRPKRETADGDNEIYFIFGV